MMTQPSRDIATWVVGLLLVAAVAVQAGRILSVRSPTGETPFHSANDRSRWCTVASLGGYGTYEIDRFLEIRDPSTKRRTWYTIDLVRHRGADGKQHYYSSKPPLLSTLHAATYALVRVATGFSLVNHTFAAARAVLLVVNLLPLVLFWILWIRYFRRKVADEWALVLIVLFLLWGNFITTFANTLNNHLPGAIFAGLALWALLRVLEERDDRVRWYVLAGFACAMTAACELPALSWLGLVGGLLFLQSPKKTMVGFVVGLLPVALGFAATNYLAHGDLRPPYAHRAAGPLIVVVEGADLPDGKGYDETKFTRALNEKGFALSSKPIIRESRTPGVLELWDEKTQYRFALVPETGKVSVHQWDDWYDYPNSYWYPDRKRGIDQGEKSIPLYTFHSLVGHHGILSLTPFWFLLPLGLVAIWRNRATGVSPFSDPCTRVMVAIVVATVVCFGFYMVRPLEDRNYGGVSSGFRWMFWFTPLWLWICSHALQQIKSKLPRRLVVLALAISIFSASVAWTNPWSHPWIWQFLESLGILKA